ncbi:unnamed protein product [Caenorhabditis auriculariae]|uniref:Uncharacterized protein n=1 Tax=Caenorhabditis auriculariae TaxID=2777116 RepID=A0A8S1H0Z5_9PELO|nr:unnamed protein product [Caenorhabditis auriculariae]
MAQVVSHGTPMGTTTSLGTMGFMKSRNCKGATSFLLHAELDDYESRHDGFHESGESCRQDKRREGINSQPAGFLE